MKIYTKTGDLGETSLLGGKRVKKSCIEMMAIGEVDELNSLIGVLIAEIKENQLGGIKEKLTEIQHCLFNVGANLAAVQTDLVAVPEVTAEEIIRLEQWIDELDKTLPPLTQFILPGGSKAATLAFLARSVCRRAERQVVLLAESTQIDLKVIKYLNRLSDTLFVLGRFLNTQAQEPEVFWKK